LLLSVLLLCLLQPLMLLLLHLLPLTQATRLSHIPLMLLLWCWAMLSLQCSARPQEEETVGLLLLLPQLQGNHVSCTSQVGCTLSSAGCHTSI
jgi:hypothetical protein